MKEREVLKLALEALKGYRRELNDGQPCDAEQAIEKLLAQPEQKPVAWMRDDEMKAMVSDEKRAWILCGRSELIEEYNKPLYRAIKANGEAK